MSRRHGRELALAYLYERQMRGLDLDGGLDAFLAERPALPEAAAFARELVQGFALHREEVDAALAAAADNWELGRMAVVDLSILRLGTYEILHCMEIPPVASINEAVEIAKRYSTAASGAFVNGILDRIHLTAPRPDETEAS